MTEIYLHIVARMADYMATHPYYIPVTVGDLSSVRCVRMRCWCLLVCCVCGTEAGLRELMAEARVLEQQLAGAHKRLT